ncbi:ABC transporter permease [Virgibacillus sp. NKC19-3]|uniref:ABC transporter permease n=1 Tax=Virgibacillus saliphilus TaxID=2831674 RepID=UPI001C9A494B|nr:ABC transporter permease [Virgibacillus sp. NKC19-3]MBY7143204.1 ABC transporter permease [Virgibacillus sp. NKC19-3]
MHSIKHSLLFMKNHIMQLRRKWLSLPLLFIFPIFIVGLIATIVITLILPPEDNPVHVGLVDLDQSNETQLMVEFIDESSLLGEYIQIHSMSEDEAVEAIERNELSAYVMFPDNFTDHLYQGTSVEFPVIGNPEAPTESYVIHELIDSVTRHISTAQANILTINHYGRELGLNADERNDLLFDQFQEFLFYTIGKDRIMNDEQVSNHATSSPVHYYGVAGWFIIVTLWLFSIYNFLSKEENLRMKQRMKLYGVTEIRQIFAKICVTLLVIFVFAVASFVLLGRALHFDLIVDDYLRIVLITLLYSIVLLQSFAIVEMALPSQKLRLLIQSLICGILLLSSGAIIPTIYFPLHIQDVLMYSFSHEAFNGLQEILLRGRLYANYIPLLLMNLVSLFILLGFSLWKERLKE